MPNAPEEERNYRLGLIVGIIERCNMQNAGMGAIEEELKKEFCRKKRCGYSKVEEYIEELIKTGRVFRQKDYLRTKPFWNKPVID